MYVSDQTAKSDKLESQVIIYEESSVRPMLNGEDDVLMWLLMVQRNVIFGSKLLF